MYVCGSLSVCGCLCPMIVSCGFYYRDLKHDPVDKTDQEELKAFQGGCNCFLKVATYCVETFRASAPWAGGEC